MLARQATGWIAAAFHNTIAAIVIEVCRRLQNGAKESNLVCLSGGTFQNFYLLERAVAGLRREGFEVFLHAQVPPNDGGISLGQAVIANSRWAGPIAELGENLAAFPAKQKIHKPSRVALAWRATHQPSPAARRFAGETRITLPLSLRTSEYAVNTTSALCDVPYCFAMLMFSA